MPMFLHVLTIFTFGRISYLASLVVYGGCFALQHCVKRVASLIIAPGGRDTIAAAENLVSLGMTYPRLSFLVGLGRGVSSGLKPLHTSGDRARAEFENKSTTSRDSYEALSIHTPDGVKIQGWLVGWPQGTAPPPRGVLMYSGGNSEICELRSDLIATWRAKGFGVLLFNYRNFGASEGTLSRDGLILDAHSALTFLTAPTEVGGRALPPHRTIAFGHSLGGAVMAEAVTLTASEGVICVNDRSFGLLSDVGAFMLLPKSVLPEVGVDGGKGFAMAAFKGQGHKLNGISSVGAGESKGESKVGGGLTGWLVRLSFRLFIRFVACWEFDTLSHWKSLPFSTKIVLFDPLDTIIPLPTALVSGLTRAGLAEAPDVVGAIGKLETPGMEGFGRGGLGQYAHNRPLSDGENERLDGVLKLACGVAPGGVVLGTGVKAFQRRTLPVTI